MKAVVLCGGLGTRLGELTRDTPKPMIQVGGRPFLAHVLDQLITADVDEIIIAVSFQWQKVLAEIGESWGGVKVRYSIELEPLGTGGAIKQAMRSAGVREALVVNGDTLLKIDVKILILFARQKQADIAIALKFMADCARFGKVSVDESGRVLAFEEKGPGGSGLINSGVYYVKAAVFNSIDSDSFSFENAVLAKHCSSMSMFGLPTDAYFIDMGVPEDLARARLELLGMS